MKKQKRNGMYLESLVDMLASKDGMVREKAREALGSMGKTAVPYLTVELKHSSHDQVRWEAAKALGLIGDPRAIPSLVKALEDGNPDVAWLAAEGLIMFEKHAWPPLLRALISDGAKSVLLLQGAHHVFRKDKEHGFNDLLETLEKDLECNIMPEMTLIAARDILKKMNHEQPLACRHA
jgi:HEAT repeat protein